jgi:hypothetical protein
VRKGVPSTCSLPRPSLTVDWPGGKFESGKDVSVREVAGGIHRIMRSIDQTIITTCIQHSRIVREENKYNNILWKPFTQLQGEA